MLQCLDEPKELLIIYLTYLTSYSKIHLQAFLSYGFAKSGTCSPDSSTEFFANRITLRYIVSTLMRCNNESHFS